jgi:lipid-A-disaccharide synthase
MRIGLVAGEASGDLLGAGLISAIRKQHPEAHFEGVAGPAMTAAGCEAWYAADELAVMGLVEPLRRLPRLLRLRRDLKRRWTENPPDVFVGIDAPDFNLNLETHLRQRGTRTVHYVSPSVWAWRERRVKKIAAAVDRVLCLLPFEKRFYEDHQVGAEFVGHPMADDIEPDPDRQALRLELGLPDGEIVALLPGSRHSEVSRLGAVFAETAAWLLQRRPGLRFVAPMANERLRDEFAECLTGAGVSEQVLLLDKQARKAMGAANVVLLASGTAALEAALLCRPMVAAYRLAPLSYFLARTLGMVKLTHFTLPNLLMREPLVPECMQENARPAIMGAELLDLLDNGERRATIVTEFAKLREELARGADQRAANAVLELIKAN